MKIPFRKLTAILLALVILVSGGSVAMAAGNRPDGDRTTSTSPSISIGGANTRAFTTSSVYPFRSMKSTIERYAETNEDVKGWLVIPNTNMSMPIVQSKSGGNNYYTYRDWKGVYHPNITYLNFVETATYLDSRVSLGETWNSSSRNTVIYGHNWTNLRNPMDIGANNNHIMFGQLPSYTDQQFAIDNPHIYFSSSENEGIWRVFSVAYVEDSFDYNQPNPSKEDFGTLINELKQRSIYNFGVDVNDDDRILTLSTCTRRHVVNGDPTYSRQRYIVSARLLRDGEAETDSVTVAVNPNPKQPRF